LTQITSFKYLIDVTEFSELNWTKFYP